ncbi:unnamed protein product [Closterium sp. Naga37s-1]|nr:unnamed protein product [Closterium sp. Naga37s-1]
MTSLSSRAAQSSIRGNNITEHGPRFPRTHPSTCFHSHAPCLPIPPPLAPLLQTQQAARPYHLPPELHRGAVEGLLLHGLRSHSHTIISPTCCCSKRPVLFPPVRSFPYSRRSKQPGPITRLLSCTEEQLKDYPNMDLAPTHTVPSMSLDPKTGEWYPAINKPYGVWHWVQHSPQAQQAEWVVILDADMVIRAPVTPWGVKAEKGKPVAAYYGYLIGCDNILAQLHTKHPELCPKVGGFIVMHIDDLRRFAPLWLSKTQEVRADKAHYARNITGDVYSSGWISEMYGYSFGAADAELHHQVDQTTMLYPGYTPTPGVDPRLLHYGLAFSVGNWSFGKSQHRTDKIVNECNRLFDPPPFLSETPDPLNSSPHHSSSSLSSPLFLLSPSPLSHHAPLSPSSLPPLPLLSPLYHSPISHSSLRPLSLLSLSSPLLSSPLSSHHSPLSPSSFPPLSPSSLPSQAKEAVTPEPFHLFLTPLSASSPLRRSSLSAHAHARARFSSLSSSSPPHVSSPSRSSPLIPIHSPHLPPVSDSLFPCPLPFLSSSSLPFLDLSPPTSASIQSSLGPAAFGPTVSSNPEGGMLRGEARGAAEKGGLRGGLGESAVTSTSVGGESNSSGSSSSISSSSSSSGGSSENNSNGDESDSKGMSGGGRLERRSIGTEKWGSVKGNGKEESGEKGSGTKGIGVGESGMEGLDTPPPVPLPLPNLGPDVPVDPARDPNLWQPFHVKGTPRLVTLFSGECTAYFDWQTLGLMYSFRRSGQPGKLVRLLACNEDMLKEYKGLDLAPTMVVPNWDHDPHNGDWYSAINKPVGVKYWLDNSPDAQLVDFVLILDADQILRRPILPWELGAERGRPVSADYGYLIGCDNILGSLHMKHPKHCDKVGGYIAIHVDDLRLLAPRWIAKTEEVRADKEHYATNITGDVYGQGWISEMYGYSFGASDANLHHVVIDNIMLYPGYPPVPNVDPRLFHYGLEVKVLNYSWDKSRFRDTPLALTCGYHFPDPPDVTDLPPLPAVDPGAAAAAAAGGKGGMGGFFAGLRGGGGGEEEREKKLRELQEERRKDFIVIECVAVLNRALREYHRLRLGCPVTSEKDVGVMDLTGASYIELGSGGGGVRELRADVWARVRDGGGGMEVEGERRMGRSEEGNEDVEQVGRFVVESVEVRERGGLERGLVVGVEMAEGERERMEERMREEGGQEGETVGVEEVGVEEQQGQNRQGKEESHVEQQLNQEGEEAAAEAQGGAGDERSAAGEEGEEEESGEDP